ncbi:MAG: hypothetical protein ACR2PG_27180 [Hyphomicrobiaceae bacterium]
MFGIAFRSLAIALLAGLFSFLIEPGGGVEAQGADGRYTMHETEGGFIRLDTQTGSLSLCQRKDENWACRALPGSNNEQREELARLRKENRELQAEIERLDQLLGLRDAPGEGGTTSPDDAKKKTPFQLPTENEVDQALDYFESILRKFQERLNRLERGSKPEEEPKRL